MTTETAEKKSNYAWTPERRAKQMEKMAQKRRLKNAAECKPPAAATSAQVRGLKPQIEADCKAAFEKLFNYVTHNGTENTVGKDENGEPIQRMFPMHGFKIDMNEGVICASWRCGWNEVDDPKTVVNYAWRDFPWSSPPADIDVLRSHLQERPRPEVYFELYWES